MLPGWEHDERLTRDSNRSPDRRGVGNLRGAMIRMGSLADGSQIACAGFEIPSRFLQLAARVPGPHEVVGLRSEVGLAVRSQLT